MNLTREFERLDRNERIRMARKQEGGTVCKFCLKAIRKQYRWFYHLETGMAACEGAKTKAEPQG